MQNQSDMQQDRDNYQKALKIVEDKGGHVDDYLSDNNMLKLLVARRGLGVSDPRDMGLPMLDSPSDGQDMDLTGEFSKTSPSPRNCCFY